MAEKLRKVAKSGILMRHIGEQLASSKEDAARHRNERRQASRAKMKDLDDCLMQLHGHEDHQTGTAGLACRMSMMTSNRRVSISANHIERKREPSYRPGAEPVDSASVRESWLASRLRGWSLGRLVH
eukprot:TRINITY_DN12252_c0_g1_i5.p2 TRINITY_DN12252_c0_g1~~TRINITY_DN12252_c0_g1_i5.p2  ORF type:complete len:127 (+),score=18.25 TRINITY_DN12252_c0_g1_i5:86-466(+)